ncbi:hypothetical protein [uncultured Methanobrevibacter sp.]|uniref:hypothetical protein n=1 Tax=uncultured Methanobrevibacter sp. TaxID=253161 RepID=UPI0025ED0355|nr:hypothetical protein [uncultured Methanobrevibacter sp.]
MYNFYEFKIVKIAESNIENFTDKLIEKLRGSELDIPITEASIPDKLKTALSFKGPKLKKALKNYQKDLVDLALNDLDFEKRKEASKGKDDKDAKDRLAVAHKTRNDQLKAQAQADLERIDDIAGGNKAIQAVAKSGKIEARIAAAKIAYKHADGQEKDALRLRLDDLSDQKQETLADINKYTSKVDDEAAKARKEQEEREKSEKETAELSSGEKREGDPSKGNPDIETGAGKGQYTENN